jgi:hypothetical protein
MGPGIPRINSVRGGFMGGVRTNYRSFFPPRFSKTPTYDGYPDYDSRDEDNYQSQSYLNDKYYKKRPESRDEDNYQSQSYSNDKYYKKRPESIYKGNIFDFIIFTLCIGFMYYKKKEISRLNTNI